MAVINGVDFDSVIDDAISAAKAVVANSWDEIEALLKNIGDGLVNDIGFIAKKKASGEFNEHDARIFIEDQKMVARIRLRSIAIVTLQLAERIWNAIAKVFQDAIKTALGWSLF